MPRRRWLVIVAVVAGLGLITGGFALWWRWDTARQPRVGDVVSTMNRAVADVVTAAGDDAAVAVSPVVRSAPCDLGPFREGGVFTAKADLYVDPGGEDALVTSLSGRLPATYRVSRGPSVAGFRALAAQAPGAAVSVAVRRISPGWLQATARSRCSLGAAATPAPAPAGDGTIALTALLRHLGTAPAEITQQSISCLRGQIVTLSAVSAATDPSGLATRLNALVPAGARRFAPGDANRVAYREAGDTVIVAASDGGTEVTAQYTTLC